MQDVSVVSACQDVYAGCECCVGVSGCICRM